jgi:hypothetical protein
MMPRLRTAPLLLALALTACGGNSPAPTATTAPPVTTTTSAPPSTAPVTSPASSPASAAARSGSATVKSGAGQQQLPEIGCEATHDRSGRVLGYFAVFGTFTGRALNEGSPRFEITLRRGYTGDGTFRTNVEYVLGAADGSSEQGPATQLVLGNGGKSGTVTFSGTGGTRNVDFTCDPADPVAATATTPAPAPVDARNTALVTADSAVIRYTALRCGNGTGDNRMFTSGTTSDLESLTVETDLQRHAFLRFRHFGVEQTYSERDYRVDVGDGDASFLHNGVALAKVEWACQY